MYLSPDFWNKLPTWLVWVFLTLLVLGFVGARLVEAYPLAAKVIPFLGRYWRNRAKRRDEVIEERAKELAAEITENMKPPDYEATMRHINHRLQLIEFSEEINQAYLIEDAKWHWAADIVIAETGSILRFPPRISYSEFSRKYREGWRPDVEAAARPGPSTA